MDKLVRENPSDAGVLQPRLAHTETSSTGVAASALDLAAELGGIVVTPWEEVTPDT